MAVRRVPPPPWMSRTLMATADGFSFAWEPEELFWTDDSQNPHMLLARALIRLRRADFAVAKDIAELLLATDDEDIWISGCHLLAHGVPHGTLREIGYRMLAAQRGANAAADCKRAYICEVWARAMLLSAVPQIIEIYLQTLADESRRGILRELAGLFEQGPGELQDGIDVDFRSYDEKEYLQALMDRYTVAFATAETTGNHLFYHGSSWDFISWVKDLLRRIAGFDEREHFVTDRLIFEAHSGLRCSHFFSANREFQPLQAAATIEEFLESGAADKYAPGGRYFFGNRIPD